MKKFEWTESIIDLPVEVVAGITGMGQVVNPKIYLVGQGIRCDITEWYLAELGRRHLEGQVFRHWTDRRSDSDRQYESQRDDRILREMEAM